MSQPQLCHHNQNADECSIRCPLCEHPCCEHYDDECLAHPAKPPRECGCYTGLMVREERIQARQKGQP